MVKADIFYRHIRVLALLAALFTSTHLVHARVVLQGLPEPPAIADGTVFYISGDAPFNDIWAFNLNAGNTGENPVRLTRHADIGRQGTVRNLVVSPENAKLIYSRWHNNEYMLYMLNTDGSGEENLTERYNLGILTRNQSYGALSPDGSLLAFIAEPRSGVFAGTRQLYLKELGNPNRLYQLTHNHWDCSYPQFADGNYIVFKAEHRIDGVPEGRRLADYMMISTYGTGLINLTGNDVYTPHFPRMGRPTLNPETGILMYGKQENDTGAYSNWHIYYRSLFDPGTEVALLTEELHYHSEDPALQPDPMPFAISGTEFIFIGQPPFMAGDTKHLFYTAFNRENPYLMQLDGTEDAFHPVFEPIPPVLERYVYIAGPQNNQQVYTRTGFEQAQVTSVMSFKDDPVFDYTGNRIAFASNGIRVMKSSGQDEIRVENDLNARYPAFTPGGDIVAYIKADDIHYVYLNIAAGDDFAQKRLTADPLEKKFDIVFSPCGARLMYTSERTGVSGRQIRYLPVQINNDTITAGTPVSLTGAEGFEHRHARFSRDGEHIIFSSSRHGGSLYLMDRNGGSQRRVELSPYIPSSPSYPVFAPFADNRISFLAGGAVHTAFMDTSTAEALIIDPPGIATTKKFDWGRFDTRTVEVERQFILKKADRDADFTYRLDIRVNPFDIPEGGIVIQETIPAGWNYKSHSYTGAGGTPSFVPQVDDTVFWSLSRQLLEEGGGVLLVTLDPMGLGADDDIRIFDGRSFDGDTHRSIRGDAYLALGPPPVPADTDGNWLIDDDELLIAIDSWAGNERIGYWPEDLADWDMWLLRLIDFWANPAGYEYDPLTGDWKKI